MTDAKRNSRFQFREIEIDLFSWTGLFEEGRGFTCVKVPSDYPNIIVIEYLIIFIDEMHAGHKGGDSTLPQAAYGEV
jgi:hypothetical protein